MDGKNPGTKQKILYAALELFAQNGFIETGIREIARAVGINEASLYSHFESKGAILDDILDYYKRFSGRYETPYGFFANFSETTGPEEVLSCLTIDFPEKEEKYYRQCIMVLFQEAGRNSAVREFVADNKIIGQQKYLEELFRRLIDVGALSSDIDVDFWAKLHVSNTYTAMGRHVLGVGEDSDRFCGKGLREMLRAQYNIMFKLHGIGASDAAKRSDL